MIKANYNAQAHFGVTHPVSIQEQQQAIDELKKRNSAYEKNLHPFPDNSMPVIKTYAYQFISTVHQL
jgi:hypothetical protein